MIHGVGQPEEPLSPKTTEQKQSPEQEVVMHVANESLANVSQEQEPEEMRKINLLAKKIKKETDMFMSEVKADRDKNPVKYDGLKSLIDGNVAGEIVEINGNIYSDVAIRDFAMGTGSITGNLVNTHPSASSASQSIQSNNFRQLDLEAPSFKSSNFYQFQQALEQTGQFHDPRSATNSLLALVTQAHDAIVSPMEEYFNRHHAPPTVRRTLTQIDMHQKRGVVVITTKELLSAQNPEKVMESTCVITIPISEFNKERSVYGRNSDINFLFKQEITEGRRRDIILQPMKSAANAVSSAAASIIGIFRPKPPAPPS